MIKTKEFDKKLFQENDEKARKATYDLFLENNIDLEANDDQYGADLVSNEYYVECEIKLLWTTNKFPFKSIQLPKRKEKFLNLDKPTLFIIWNKDLTSYVLFDTISVKESPCVEVPNKYVNRNEYFYQVDVTKSFTSIKEYLEHVRQRQL